MLEKTQNGGEVIEPKVSIVISNYNGLRHGVLGKCLFSVLEMTYPNYEVIVVDNCSSDGSLEYIKEHFRRRNLRAIKNSENNYAKGLNIGLENAIGEYILYLNNDTRVDPSFLQPLVQDLKGHENVAAVQCMLINAHNGKIDSLGEVIDTFGYFQSLGQGQDTPRRLTNPFEIPFLNGSAFLIRKNTLRQINGFDPTYYSGYEDVDMCLKVRSLGYKILSEPKSLVYHARGTTFRSETMRTFGSFHFNKNRLTTLFKFYPVRKLTLIMPTLILFYMAEFSYISTIKRKHQLGITRLWALEWFIKNFKYELTERRKVQKNIKYHDAAKFISKGLFFVARNQR
jgi:hypothetical protein